MTQQFFKLKSNGKVCRVLATDTNTVGGKGFDCFVQIEEPDYFDVVGYSYIRWVAVCRGEFVEEPTQPTQPTSTVAPAPAPAPVYKTKVQRLLAMCGAYPTAQYLKKRGYTLEQSLWLINDSKERFINLAPATPTPAEEYAIEYAIDNTYVNPVRATATATV